MESLHRKISFISIISSFLFFYIWLVYVYSIDTYIWAMSVENKSSFLLAFTRAVELSCIQFGLSWVEFSSVRLVSRSLVRLCVFCSSITWFQTLWLWGFAFIWPQIRDYTPELFSISFFRLCVCCYLAFFFPVAIFLFHLVSIYVVLFSLHFSKNFGLFCLSLYFFVVFSTNHSSVDVYLYLFAGGNAIFNL